jgi:endonuclease/exonuclease/phosphatase family metal-dependent hydrolase
LISNLVKLKRRLRRKFSRTRWVARLINRELSAVHSDEPGLVVLQIDGLSRKQFESALRAGKMPFLRRLIERGYFEELTFYSGLPSTTPAVQAEVMFGARTAVPAFQYLDRNSGRTVLMYDSAPARAVGQRLARDHQPLLEGGRSYSNIYAAGAAEARLCAETMDLKTLREMTRPWKLAVVLALFGTTILRIATLAVLELFIALWDFVQGIAGREHWRAEWRSVWSRIGVSIVMREWLRIVVKLSIEEGAPIIYANFLGYDEQAHRRGPDSAFAHWGLKGIDQTVQDIFNRARKSDLRDYEVVVFSDHGQERTKIYEVQQGVTVQQAAATAFREGPLAGRSIVGLDDYGRRGPVTDQRARRLLRLERGRTLAPQATAEQLAEAVIVTALGPLGHIYLPVRLDDAAKAQYARALVEGQRIPLVAYRTEDGTLTAHNRRGRWRLPQDAPLVFGPGHPLLEPAAADLVRLCEHPDAGDFVISGWSCEAPPLTFVQENGAHGSIGDEETRGFALIPHALHPHRRHAAGGEAYIRGVDMYRAAWRFVHPGRPLARPHHEPAEPTPATTRAVPRDGALRVMTYNIHSCIGIDGKVRPERIVAVIRSCRADVVALQEVDAYRLRSRGHEQARFIAEALAMGHHYYAISDFDGEQYGLAVVSRYPLVHVQSGHLTPPDPRRRSEARGALWVQLDAPGGPVQLINTHFGLRRDEREQQARILLGDEWLGQIPASQPVVLCGDMNAGPRSPVWRSFASRLNDAQVHAPNFRPRATFLSTMPVRRLDHIFVSEHFSIRTVAQPRNPTATVASDHLPVCAELVIKPQAAASLAAAKAQQGRQRQPDQENHQRADDDR